MSVGIYPHAAIPSLLKQAETLGNLLQQTWHTSRRLQPAGYGGRRDRRKQ
jgi:hypothetical protein